MVGPFPSQALPTHGLHVREGETVAGSGVGAARWSSIGVFCSLGGCSVLTIWRRVSLLTLPRGSRTLFALLRCSIVTVRGFAFVFAGSSVSLVCLVCGALPRLSIVLLGTGVTFFRRPATVRTGVPVLSSPSTVRTGVSLGGGTRGSCPCYIGGLVLVLVLALAAAAALVLLLVLPALVLLLPLPALGLVLGLSLVLGTSCHQCPASSLPYLP